jgi:eukaryotic-like serine/threonine-protein kinase
MTGPERHQKTGELFDAALELAPEAREAFLQEACGGDAELRVVVQRLLNNHAISGTFLEPLLERSGPGNVLRAFAADSAAPETVGPYRIIRQLGEGGMGTVYLAQQERPIQRDVALKIIKPGMDSSSVLARFDSERRALALMEHPNIAQVFDAGTTPGGLPYFAMELVDGVPITQYCSANKLGIRQRIELFIPVCQAIQHAHQKGIIHRDIKPSNVLVKISGGKPVPKVIDFGLAKAIGNGIPENTLLTHMGTIVGTLQYMSPEQAAMDPCDVDTRSDIYSLGALLYELLTGTPPLDAERIAKDNYLAVLHKIREEEPQTPNARLRQTASGPAAKPLDSELDWIPLKALEKERSRRYETVNGLVQDLARYLAGEPVEAAPASRGYRMTKFVRKHRSMLATAAAFVIVLLGGIAVSAWMAVRATRAEQEARAINEFLARDLLGQADPGMQGGREGPDPSITVRTAVERAASGLGRRFPGQPQVEASLRHTIGSIYTSLGLLERGRDELRTAVSMRGRLLGNDHSATLESQQELGLNLLSSGDALGAERVLTAAVETAARKLGRGHLLTLQISDSLGLAKYTLGKLDESLALLEPSERLASEQYGPRRAETLELQYSLFLVYFAKASYREAKRELSKAIETTRSVYGNESTKALALDGGLAMLDERQGRFREAEEKYAKILAADRRLYGVKHQTTLQSIGNLASNLIRQGRYAEAEALLWEDRNNRDGVFAPEHPQTLQVMISWAELYTAQDRLTQADEVFAKLFPVLQKTLPDDHLVATIARSRLAGLRVRQKRYSEAEALLRRNLGALQRKLGTDNLNTLAGMTALVHVLLPQSRYAEAEPLARQAADRLAKIDPDSWLAFHARSLWGASCAAQRYDEAAVREMAAGYEGLRRLEPRMEAFDRGLVAEAKHRLDEFGKEKPGPVRH